MKLDKRTLNNIFFAFGLIAVVVMMFTFDVSFPKLWYYLCKAGYWLIPIVGVWVFVYGINALSWSSVIRGNTSADEHVGFWRIFKLTITGYALNYATPVGGLGGEPYRIMELSRDMEKSHATSSVILYAMMHIFAHFWLWFTSIFVYLGLAAMGDLPLPLGIRIVLTLIFFLCLLAFYVFSKGYRNGLVVKVIKWVGKIPGLKGWSVRFSERNAETLQNIDRQITALHQQDKRAFYSSFLLEYLSRIVQAFEIMFVLLLFGIDAGGGTYGLFITFLHSVLILAFTSLFANLIGFLPMQLGVQEGGFVLSIAALGLSPELGIFTSIIYRVREIIWIIIGLILMKIDD